MSTRFETKEDVALDTPPSKIDLADALAADPDLFVVVGADDLPALERLVNRPMRVVDSDGSGRAKLLLVRARK